MDEKKVCGCARPRQRTYYSIMGAIFLIIIIIEVVTLGTFGVQFTRTMAFWRDHDMPGADSEVCVLYGRSSTDGINPILTNNVSCGFSFWGIVTILIVLLIWMILHAIMAALGKPRM